MLNSCLFAGMAFARVIVLNILKPNGVSCPGPAFSPRLFFQAAGLRYSVQNWNACPAPARWTRDERTFADPQALQAGPL